MFVTINSRLTSDVSLCRWQQLERGDNDEDSVFSSSRHSLNSQGSRRPSKDDSGHGSYARTEDKQFTRVSTCGHFY